MRYHNPDSTSRVIIAWSLHLVWRKSNHKNVKTSCMLTAHVTVMSNIATQFAALASWSYLSHESFKHETSGERRQMIHQSLYSKSHHNLVFRLNGRAGFCSNTYKHYKMKSCQILEIKLIIITYVQKLQYTSMWNAYDMKMTGESSSLP
jgi:hypothetical protein